MKLWSRLSTKVHLVAIATRAHRKKEDCPIPKLPDCPEGEVAKMHTRKQKCPEFVCECDPALCSDVVWPTDLEVGQFVEKLTDQCCQKIKISCNHSSCPRVPKCEPLLKLIEIEGECCKTYKCKPQDGCVFMHQYEVVEGFQLPLNLEDSEPALYKAGEKWEDGLCEKCTCETINEQHFPNCIEEQCTDLSSSVDNEDYVLREFKVPGKCCPEIVREQCKDKEGNVYLPGEQWSDEEDPCVSYTCEDLGDIQITKNKITCVECPRNAELIPPSKFLGQCCGICHVTKCEENEQLYEVGDTWVSDEHPCREAECLKEFGDVKIVYTKQSCPIIPKDCPKDKIVRDTDGCCDVCNVTSEISCSSGPLPEADTIDFFKYEERNGVVCANDKPIPDILQCKGACHSRSYYSLEDGDFKDTCQCCKVNVTVNRTVDLLCPDGNRIKKTFLQPETCQCSKCAPKDPTTGKVKNIDFTKTNRNQWSQSEIEDIGQRPYGQEFEKEYDPFSNKGVFSQQQMNQFSFDNPEQKPEEIEFSQQVSQEEEDYDFFQQRRED